MTKRDVFLVIFYTIITCGIYQIYWMYVTTEELNKKDQGEPLQNYIVALLLSIVTCGIYGIYWLYKFYRKVDVVTNENNYLLNLLLSLFCSGIVGMAIAQNSFNKLED